MQGLNHRPRFYIMLMVLQTASHRMHDLLINDRVEHQCSRQRPDGGSNHLSLPGCYTSQLALMGKIICNNIWRLQFAPMGKFDWIASRSMQDLLNELFVFLVYA